MAWPGFKQLRLALVATVAVAILLPVGAMAEAEDPVASATHANGR